MFPCARKAGFAAEKRIVAEAEAKMVTIPNEDGTEDVANSGESRKVRFRTFRIP